MSGERFSNQTLDEMPPEQRKAAEAIMAGPRGGMRGPFKALLRSPDLADKVQRVGEYVRFRTSLHQRLSELGILMVGRYWSAQYEFYAHRQLAEKAGLSPSICDAIAEGRRPGTMDDEERVVWEFANELLQTKEVSDTAFAGVKEKFGEQGVIDLVGSMGYYTIVSMVLNVDRVPLPPDAVPLKKLGG